MSTTSVDQKLLDLLTTATPATIDDVINLMQSIDALLPGDDGLKWFNLLYLLVTREVHTHPPASGWNDPAWVTRLDVIFANYYFMATANFLSQGNGVPSSWQALFEARHRPRVDRIQFALAGMNAHINHDLSLALLDTDAEMGLIPSLTSPQHDDFEHVNGLLEAVLPQALQFLATGVLGQAAQDTGKIGQLLALWNVRVARDLAWDFADHLRALSGITRKAALLARDKFTGALGRSLLLPLA